MQDAAVFYINLLLVVKYFAFTFAAASIKSVLQFHITYVQYALITIQRQS
jgi:hypothetical protein